MQKIADFFRWLGQKLVQGGKWVVTALLLIAIAVTGFIIADNQAEDNSETTSDRPQIAQVFEPSIGTPLPPDVAEEESTTPEQTATPDQPNQQIAGDNTEQQFIAPPTGIDDDEPIKYHSEELGFRALLPPSTQVVEEGSTISFFTKSGKLLYAVSKTPQQNREEVQQQLRLSNHVSKIEPSVFAGQAGWKFQVGNQAGLAVLAPHGTFYLTGNAEHFDHFSL